MHIWKNNSIEWSRKNCLLIVLIGVISGLKYTNDYFSILNLNFDHDGFISVFYAILFSVFCIILLFISIFKSSGRSVFLDFLGAVSQLLAIFYGNDYQSSAVFAIAINIILILTSLLILWIMKNGSKDRRL
jgi:hypothetical protein